MTIGEGFLDGCRNYVNRNLIVSSLRYYQVSIPLAWLDELQVHRLYSLAVALDDPFHGLAAFNYVTGHYPHEPVVIVMSISLRSLGSVNIRIPSTIITSAGFIVSVSV